jgi:SARP family transcriptional regulator, regulator of embCAB operon
MPDTGESGTVTARTPARTEPVDELRFTLLGQLEILKGGIDHAPTAPKVLQLMALLLTQPGRVVHVESIIEELWSEKPPRSARTTVQTYVYHLRRCIQQNGLADDAEAILSTRPPGYVLRVRPAQVDVHEFERLRHDGREQFAAGRAADAARTLRAALATFAGPPLANVACGPVLSRFVVDLEEQRRTTRHLRIEADIACGTHRELVGELRTMTSVDLLDEVLHGQLIRVLARSGRRSEAMCTYRNFRARLVDELGVEPSDDLQNLHLTLLSGEAEAV